ncbi:3-hydroxyacid dehydrogenase/reductase [Cordyceps fumosorosea ARSEF 2679]|uniref:3-hydroxyacid dehydrogenase/reductase n=1 Tax=Cordyceps fumosorosea (strain ARSEF 2679) TaxID=1081104 RepID=A0A162N1D6_CORFA|nr:3-hydroxyacid dehydrogenase/reductase [Cordyceps fumosorosea ARSEF 2679]OAA73929.1 3-hydroxyacid dehydrogenase/reductase [Cordyceps fumosorosea ARSEF 2679]
MAGANTTVVAVVANPSTDITWYSDALQNSAVTVQYHSAASFTPYAASKTELHDTLSCTSTTLLAALPATAGYKLTRLYLGLPHDSLILVAEPVPDTLYESLETALTDCGRGDLQLIAASVSQSDVFVAGPSHAIESRLALLQGPGAPVHPVSSSFGSSAAKLRLVHDHLLGVHAVAATEAMSLAARAGLNTNQVYDIIVNAAGNSAAFETRARKILDADSTPHCTLGHTRDKLASFPSLPPATDVVVRARDLRFPLPLASAAEQLFVMASSLGYGALDDSAVVRAYLPHGGGDVIKEATRRPACANELTPTSSPGEIASVGMVGLGAMGQGMAASLLRAGFTVSGFDMNTEAVSKFVSNSAGARGASSAADAMSGAAVVILMVQNAAQADDILFGSGNGADALSDQTVVVLSSTVPPSFVRELAAKLQNLGRGLSLLDAPVSGGVARATNGTLAIICSGEDSSLARSRAVLLAMAGPATNLHAVQGGVGAASSVKLVNQLLAGVHIAAAAEAMALAARLGLPTRAAFEILVQTGAWSWMLANRTGQMLEADWTPHSALAIFVKDLGIVLDEARRLGCYVPIAAAAHTLYVSGAAHGWDGDADAGVVRLWEELSGVSVSDSAQKQQQAETVHSQQRQQPSDRMNPPRLPAAETLRALPPEYDADDVLSSIRRVVNGGGVPTLVILDDDPTGTQTCHDINVLAVWDSDTLAREFRDSPAGFFILTNSRALPSAEARRLIHEICEGVRAAAAAAGKPFEIVLRGDSTLRGHLPDEPEAVEAALGRFDGWVLAPFFSQGGRLTVDDVHYVREGDELVPVSRTPFAQDATFGYRSSNLREYVLEKCGSRFDDGSFVSVTLNDIRLGGPSAVARKLLSVASSPDLVVIVNAVVDADMHVFVAGLLEAERHGRRYLFRTGAAFVSSRLGISAIPPLTPKDLGVAHHPSAAPRRGGLILAGSYVPKTTAQLRRLRERRGPALLHVIELPVPQLIGPDTSAADALVAAAAREASATVVAGKDVLVMTSRTLIRGEDALDSLQVGARVAAALVALLRGVEARPRYVVAKGGITASDAATNALGMRRARVRGQAASGVPLWVCDEETSRHRGVPYVVFPGNVGDEDALADVVEAWAV